MIIRRCLDCGMDPDGLAGSELSRGAWDSASSLVLFRCRDCAERVAILNQRVMNPDAQSPAVEHKNIKVSTPTNPAHYASGEVECIDALRSALTPEEFRGYCKGSAMSYLWRLGRKDAPEQEARKAAWYVSWLAGDDPRKDGK